MTPFAPAGAIQLWMVAFLLVMVRVLAFVLTAPMLGDVSVPRTVKIGMAVALSSVWLIRFGEPNSAVAALAVRDDMFAYVLAVSREVVIGAVFGFVFSLLLVPARIAGAYIGQEMGLSLGSAADPSLDPNASVVSQLFFALAALALTALDVDHAMLATFHASLAAWPVAAGGPGLPWTSLIQTVSHSNEAGLMIAAPIGACLFATTVIVTLLMKAAPQFNLLSVGIPLRVLAGAAAMVLLLPVTLFLMGRFMASGAEAFMSLAIP